MFKVVAALVVWALLAGGADAAPEQFSPEARERLDNGGRTRVIVTLSPAPVDMATSPFDMQAAWFSDQRDVVFRRVLGADSDTLAQGDGVTEPQLARAFSMTPSAALVLSADEIAAFEADPSVIAVFEDELSAPNLDESVPLIGASTLHASGQTGAGVSIAILDTGTDHEHIMTGPGIVESACFSSTVASQSASTFCPNGLDTDTTSVDAGDNCEERSVDPINGATGCFHGTHVGAIAAGREFNSGLGVLEGVAPGAGIVAVQVFSQFNSSSTCGSDPTPCVRSFSSDQLAALEWLYLNRDTLNLAAINMSLGGGKATSHCTTHPAATVVGQLRTAGVATVISSGNSGYSDGVGSPSCIEPAISTGSTTKADGLSGFSNSSPLVDLLAPGSSIGSALSTRNDSVGTASATTASGTSMAAPHAAGAFALLRAAHPDATMDELEAALQLTGVAIRDSRNNVTRSRIQVDAADNFLDSGFDAGDLAVSPSSGFETSGEYGNAGSFGTQVYTLTNNGGVALNYTISSDESWLTFSAVSSAQSPQSLSPAASANGVLDAGESVDITVGVDTDGLAPGGYQAAIDIDVDGGESTQRAAQLSITPPPPLNNDFANAAPISLLAQTIAITTTGADKESGEPNHAGNSGGASIWYRWTPGVDADVRIRTADAAFDTMLAVYTGTTLGTLSEVASNDDIDLGVDTESRVDVSVDAGTTYYVVVDGWGGDAGDADLVFTVRTAPENDDFADAIGLGGAQQTLTTQNFRATRETGEPSHGGDSGGSSIWYAWAAPQDGLAAVDVSGSQIDAVVGVYTTSDGGATLDAAAPVDGSDGSDGLYEFTAASGQTYYIGIDGTGGDEGLIRLQIAAGIAEGHRPRASVLPNARAVSVGETATAFATVINPGRFGAALENCRIETPRSFNGEFHFQTTNPATNELTGSEDADIDIASGGVQTFLFSFAAGEAVDGLEIAPHFVCDNGLPAPVTPGVNTFTLSASPTETADIVTIASTIGGTGVATPPLSARTAFSVAAINIGAPGEITATPGDGGAGLPLDLEICQTDPGTGACLAGRSASVDVDFERNETATFTVFVGGTGVAVASNPAVNRVRVEFTNGDGVLVGSTSVAVETAE